MKAFQYVFWLPAGLGLMVFWRRSLSQPVAWVMLLVCGTILGLLWRLASVMGYVSDRHTVLVVLCGCFWIAAILEAWVGRAIGWCRGDSRRLGFGITTLVFGLLVAMMLPMTLEPLHGDRAGFRTVGLWLGEHADPQDTILDPYCWTAFYAGVDFRPAASAPPGRTRFIILEESGNPHGHLPLHRRAQHLSGRANLVYTWSGHRGKCAVAIQVFAVPER